MNKRIYVEKKEKFQSVAQTTLEELKTTLKLNSLKSLIFIFYTSIQQITKP